MAITIDIQTEKVMELEEYKEYIKANVDIHDMDSIIESAPALKALGNNRRFMVDKLNEELEKWRNFQPANRYTAQTMLFGGGSNFLVRANVWEPPSHIPEREEIEKKLFLYRVPHDHNFTFMTIGYLGSGYETTIFEYERDSVVGMPGEEVGLRFLEKTSLPQGKIMLYRACKDVHSQEHSKEFSISLNLLIQHETMHSTNQYFFDLDHRTIESFVPTGGTSRVMLCSLAKHVGNGRTVELLSSLLKSHMNDRVRAGALDSLCEMVPDDTERFCTVAMQDSHPSLQLAANQKLDMLNKQ